MGPRPFNETLTRPTASSSIQRYQSLTAIISVICNTARFDSREACIDALQATAKATDIQFDEREERTREVYNLVEPS